MSIQYTQKTFKGKTVDELDKKINKHLSSATYHRVQFGEIVMLAGQFMQRIVKEND